MLQLPHDNPGVHEKIIMNEYDHFHLDGYVNSRFPTNTHLWIHHLKTLSCLDRTIFYVKTALV